MIGKLSFYMFLVMMLLFSGCSQKDPGFDDETTDEMVDDELAEDIESDDDLLDDDELADDELDLDDEEVGSGDAGNIYFAFDKFYISGSMQNVVSSNVEAASGASSIKLEGNCDEWGTDEYNYALGLKRANSVKNAMISEGADASAISIVSFGESNPTCSTKAESCWKLNRRVETKIR